MSAHDPDITNAHNDGFTTEALRAGFTTGDNRCEAASFCRC